MTPSSAQSPRQLEKDGAWRFRSVSRPWLDPASIHGASRSNAMPPSFVESTQRHIGIQSTNFVLVTRAILLIAIMAAGGCATIHQPLRGDLASTASPVQSCAKWIQRVDDVVDAAGVRDAQPWRVPGFPYLRLDRFTGSFVQRSAANPALFHAWVARARDLDRSARAVELQNLPDSALASLHLDSRQAAIQRTEMCAARLEDHDLTNPAERTQLIRVAAVPDGYSMFARTLGLYPLMRIPFAQGVKGWHADTVRAFKHFANSGAPDTGTGLYTPAPSAVLSPAQVAAIIARGNRRPLGIPDIGPRQRALLLSTFAPVIQVQTRQNYDRIGALYWDDSPVPQVRSTHPMVYGRITYTRYGDHTLLQLVYTAWFPERPSGSPLDILAGKLDGVVFRVTLGPHGRPLVYDSVHPCGCYHMFFPTSRVTARPPPNSGDEWAFSPARAPTPSTGNRILLYVASRTHYLSGIGVYATRHRGAQQQQYNIVPENSLLTLPLPDGGTRSVFGPDGLVAGTQRPERWLFWPMGVPSAGTMRQSGTRDTAFLGQQHFDDPYLIEQRFRIVDQ